MPFRSFTRRRRSALKSFGLGGSSFGVEQLEVRSLLTVTFVFNYPGAVGSGIGFEAANGQARRDALQLVGNRLGSQFTQTATITLAVTSEEDAQSTTLASAGSEFSGSPQDGFSSNEVVRTKILTGTDLNGAAADGTVNVNWGIPWEISSNPADIAPTEYDFYSTMYHELLHAMGWFSSITVDGKDLRDSVPSGQAGAWSFFDQFIADASGTPVISGTTLALNAASWNTNKVGGASPAAGLFFNGPNARAANGNTPVGLFTPATWSDGSSVSHLDDENPALQPLLMASATGAGVGNRNLSQLERAILRDVGYSFSQGAISVTQSGGTTVVSENGTTDSFSVKLSQQPLVNVVLNISSGNTAEATVDKATLTFTPDNWNLAQTVTVTGVNDAIVDGTKTTIVTLSVNAASSDDGYDTAINATVSVSTLDNDGGLATPILNAIPGTLSAQPTVSWQAVPGATRYEIWFSRTFPNAQRIYLDSNITTTSWTVPAPLASGQYRYWVRAFDAGSAASPWSASKTFIVRPALVSPLAGSYANPTTFQWQAIPFASSYELFLRTSAGDQTITSITTNSYTPAAALPAGAIQWWVRASGFPGGTNAGWSFAGNASTNPLPVITAPVGTVNSTPTITWTLIPGASRYILHIERIDAPGVAVIRENNLTTTSFTVTAPLAAGGYRAWIKAIDGATNQFANGQWSAARSFTVASVAPQPDNSDDFGGDVQLTLLPQLMDRKSPKDENDEKSVQNEVQDTNSQVAAYGGVDAIAFRAVVPTGSFAQSVEEEDAEVVAPIDILMCDKELLLSMLGL